MNKNLTLSIDEDLLDKARVLAAMRRTSVNEMVRGKPRARLNRPFGPPSGTPSSTKLMRRPRSRCVG